MKVTLSMFVVGNQFFQKESFYSLFKKLFWKILWWRNYFPFFFLMKVWIAFLLKKPKLNRDYSQLGKKLKKKSKIKREMVGIEMLSSMNSSFSKIVAKIAAIIPAHPILRPINIQVRSIAKEPSQALILLLYFKFLTIPETPSPKDIKRAEITPNQKDLSKNQPIKITIPHIKQKLTS